MANEEPVKYGIDNIKTVLKFGADFGEDVAEVMEDGKFKLLEATKFIGALLQVPGVTKAVPHLRKEFSDLDDAENAALAQFVRDELDIPNDHVEGFIEDAWEWGLRLLSMVERFKAIKAAKN